MYEMSWMCFVVRMCCSGRIGYMTEGYIESWEFRRGEGVYSVKISMG